MQPIQDNYNSTYIATATTTQVVNAPCRLVRIILTETAAGTITIYNETGSGTTDIKALMKASIVEGTYEFGVKCSAGLKIVTAGASKLTVVWANA